MGDWLLDVMQKKYVEGHTEPVSRPEPEPVRTGSALRPRPVPVKKKQKQQKKRVLKMPKGKTASKADDRAKRQARRTEKVAKHKTPAERTARIFNTSLMEQLKTLIDKLEKTK
jgi:hypothetical protein